MKNRKSTSTRHARRRRFLAQLLASISMGVGANAMAETELAYYAAHPSEMKNKVRTVDGEGEHSYRSILQVQAVQQDPLSLPDSNVPSSSDNAGDDFLPEPLEPLADPVTGDVDAVVDQAQTIPMPVQPFTFDGDAGVFAPPAPAPTRTRTSLGAVAGAYSSAPNMMGDFGILFNGSLLGSTVALAGGDRRFKISENVSPMPQDRLLFNYNHFHNALIDINGVSRNLDRFTFGFEKTFWNGNASFEARLPFASALNSTQIVGVTDTQATELGNIAGALKFRLLSGCNWLVSGGATMTLPTGDDYIVLDGQTETLVHNDAVHLAPFLGFLAAPNQDWFLQGFIQTDFDLNGNDVYTDRRFEGVLQDQNLLFIDASVGRWLHRSCDPCKRLTGIAAILELHYTSTMNDTDGVAGISNPFNRIDLLNATGAMNFQFGQTQLRVGGAAPLRDDEESTFDAEVLVQLNRYY